MNWIDIGVIVILIFSSFIGYKQGFILSAFNLAGIVISYFLARMYYPIVAQFILNNQTIYGKIRGFVDNRLYSIFEDRIEGIGTIPILEGINLPKSLSDILSKSPDVISHSNEISGTAVDIMSEALTLIFIDVISFIVAFIIIRIILIFAVKLLNAFFELPILKQFNKLLGFGFGFIKGILIILLIFAMFIPFVSVSPDGMLAEGIYNSEIGYYLYDNNILLKYLKEVIL